MDADGFIFRPFWSNNRMLVNTTTDLEEGKFKESKRKVERKFSIPWQQQKKDFWFKVCPVGVGSWTYKPYCNKTHRDRGLRYVQDDITCALMFAP